MSKVSAVALVALAAWCAFLLGSISAYVGHIETAEECAKPAPAGIVLLLAIILAVPSMLAYIAGKENQ